MIFLALRLLVVFTYSVLLRSHDTKLERFLVQYNAAPVELRADRTARDHLAQVNTSAKNITRILIESVLFGASVLLGVWMKQHYHFTGSGPLAFAAFFFSSYFVVQMGRNIKQRWIMR